MQSAGAGSPLGPRTTSPPESATQQTPGATTQSPMAALMSVADTLPPGSPRSAGGSPPGAGGPRSASRGSQHSPNSSGKLYHLPPSFTLGKKDSNLTLLKIIFRANGR